MPEIKNYYRILQVDPSAESEIIIAAYKRLALKYHPDTNKSPEALGRMQEINEAYSILRDPTKRANYDEQRRQAEAEAVKREKERAEAQRAQDEQRRQAEAEAVKREKERAEAQRAQDEQRRQAEAEAVKREKVWAEAQRAQDEQRRQAEAEAVKREKERAEAQRAQDEQRRQAEAEHVQKVKDNEKTSHQSGCIGRIVEGCGTLLVIVMFLIVLIFAYGIASAIFPESWQQSSFMIFLNTSVVFIVLMFVISMIVSLFFD